MCERRNPDQSFQSTRSVQCDLLPDPYCVLNENAKVAQINQAGSELLEPESGDIEGKPLTDMLDTDSKARFQASYPKVIAGERVSGLSLSLRSTAGDSVIVSCNINPEYDRRDQFVGAHCIFRDVTAKKQRETELMRFRSLLNQSYDGILIIDPNGFEIVDANDTICNWLGYTREKVLSLHPWDIETTMSDPAVWPKGLERLRNIKNKQYEGENRRRDGSTFPVEVRLSLVSLERDYIVVQARDITERRKRERELEATTQRLKESNEKLKQFADVVSHDLRNPLNVAKGRLDLANEEHDDDHLEVVARSHDRMEALITDLLTLAREGKTVETAEWVDFETLVENCWEIAETAEAKLVTDIDGRIRADESRLQQLLENLIRNAVDHGGEDVTISIGALDDGFYVFDDGPGIPEAERKQIFNSGYTTSRDGTGLGLSIVQEIAHAHGWEITIRDGRDGGACFEVTGGEVSI